MAKNNVKPGAAPYAGLKTLGEHLIVIFVFNAVLAAVVFLSNNQGPINWPLLVTSLVAQGVLALLDSLKQYMLANNQPGIAGLIGIAEQNIQARVPSPLNSAAQATAQAFNGQQQQALQAQPLTIVRTSTTPVSASQITNISTVDTLPLIQAVQPPQAPQPPSSNV